MESWKDDIGLGYSACSLRLVDRGFLCDALEEERLLGCAKEEVVRIEEMSGRDWSSKDRA